MKMKKWLAVSMTALAMAAGTMAVSADSLTLSGGEVLDMGSSVSVYRRKVFLWKPAMTGFWKRMRQNTWRRRWKEQRYFQKTRIPPRVQMAVSILRTGKVYQVRAQADDALYQGMMVSLSVSGQRYVETGPLREGRLWQTGMKEKIADVKAASSQAGASENSLDRALCTVR